MRQWDITGESMMKKLIVELVAFVACMPLSGFAINDCCMDNFHAKEAGNDYLYLTDVTAWRTATESDVFSIYYKEGNGERVYYFSGNHWSIHDNHYYQSSVCDDFRKSYKYVSGDYYFNCDLPGWKKEVIDGYHFLSQVKGWRTPIDSDIFSIYYREGNGERVYYFSGNHWSIHDNHYYQSLVCDDYRKNYQYVSGDYYFNCELPEREEEVVDGYHFCLQVKGWRNAVDSDVFSIYYKVGNGKKVYYFGDNHWSIRKNKYYKNPECSDFRKEYKYVSGDYYFNLPKRK